MLSELAVCWGVKLPGEWETVVTGWIFNIPEREESINIIGTCPSAAPANITGACASCVGKDLHWPNANSNLYHHNLFTFNRTPKALEV